MRAECRVPSAGRRGICSPGLACLIRQIEKKSDEGTKRARCTYREIGWSGSGERYIYVLTASLTTGLTLSQRPPPASLPTHPPPLSPAVPQTPEHTTAMSEHVRPQAVGTLSYDGAALQPVPLDSSQNTGEKDLYPERHQDSESATDKQDADVEAPSQPQIAQDDGVTRIEALCESALVPGRHSSLMRGCEG